MAEFKKITISIPNGRMTPHQFKTLHLLLAHAIAVNECIQHPFRDHVIVHKYRVYIADPELCILTLKYGDIGGLLNCRAEPVKFSPEQTEIILRERGNTFYPLQLPQGLGSL